MKRKTEKRRNIMKRYMLFGIIVCVGIFIANSANCAPPPPPTFDINLVNTPLPVEITGITPVPTVNSAEYRFVGYSENTTQGGYGGIQMMNNICQESFAQMRE